MRHTLLHAVLLVVLLAMTASCRQAGQSPDGPHTLTVTIEPLRYFAERLAGPHFRVTSMVPEGSSPETYDPTPQQLVDLSRSQAYLRIGYIGFEQAWMERLRANVPQMQVFDTSEGVSLIRDEGHTHGDHVHAGGVEPHIWNSPVNARLIAHNVYEALCRLDSTHTADYTARLDSLNRVIDRTDSIVRSLLSDGADRAFLIYHPALSYFARDYGLEQLCLEEGGKEPSPAHLQRLIRECRTKGVRTVFVQKEFDSRNAELVAKEIGAQLVTINPLDYHWDEELIRTARALSKQLPKPGQ